MNEATENQAAEADTKYLDLPFPTALVAIKEVVKGDNGKNITVHKSNAQYGYIPLSAVIDGMPEPDKLAEIDLGDKAGTKTFEPVYVDQRANWLQQTLNQRIRSIAAGKIKQGNPAPMCWRDVLEASNGPKFMSLLKEARGLFYAHLEENYPTLSPAGVEQLSSSFFGGESLKAAEQQTKDKVAGYIDSFEKALDSESQALYASVLRMVRNDIEFDNNEVLF